MTIKIENAHIDYLSNKYVPLKPRLTLNCRHRHLNVFCCNLGYLKVGYKMITSESIMKLFMLATNYYMSMAYLFLR